MSKSNEQGENTVVYQSEVISSSSPTWPKFKARVQDLCNGDIDREILLSVHDYSSRGNHKLVGQCNTTIREMTENPNTEWQLRNPKTNKSKGRIHLMHANKERIHTFLEYLQGGMEMNFEVGIDFTQSNGPVTDRSSLHYINHQIPGATNEYSVAIRAVGDIIQDYDTDKLFPVYGFGARLPPSFQVSHRFACNFNPNDPNCHMVDGILEAYQRCIRSVQLWGPTNFSPIINGVTAAAKQDVSGRQYWVLLMITDGIISDMEATKKAIVQAAKYPISIIIIGVGDADFTNMDVLDGDDVRVSHNGELACRDIVQFVPIRDFMKPGTQSVLSQARLAQEVLQEIPEQVTGWMSMKKIVPNDTVQFRQSLHHNQSMHGSTQQPPSYAR